MSINDLLNKLTGDDSKIDTSFDAATYLTPSYVFRVQYRFGRKQQEMFLKHFFSIRGDGGSDYQVAQYPEILEKMAKLYEVNIKKNKSAWAVAHLLHMRIREGYSLSHSMSDIFDVSFLATIQALESTTSKNVVKAVDIATKNAIALKQAISKVYMFTVISTVLLTLAIVGSGYAYRFYEAKLLEAPAKLQFIQFPEPLFVVTTFISNNLIVFGIALIISIVTNYFVLKNIHDERRVILDKYYPPAIFIRLISSVRIFTGLSLLVSIIGKQTLDALKLLRDNCTKYEERHLDEMIKRLTSGESGTNQLDTGLLSGEVSLSLKMANLGQSATVKTALNILANEGQDKLLAAINKFSITTITVGILGSVFIAIMSGGLVAQVFMAQMM